MPFHGKPILGIIGGIGSGKSHVARLLGSLGYVVIHSDEAVHAVYADPDVIRSLLDVFGPPIRRDDGTIDRRAIAAEVFNDPSKRTKLEALIHPRVHQMREQLMVDRADDSAVRGFVWDSPLLIEADLHRQCDAVIFVDTADAIRLKRVRDTRRWDESELSRRESTQLPLSDKRRHATHVIAGDKSDEETIENLRAAGF